MRRNFARIIAIGVTAIPLASALAVGSLWLVPNGPAGHANAGSVAMMQVLSDEHSLVADYLKSDTEAQRQANAAADAEVAQLRLAAIEQRQARLAQIEREAAGAREAEREQMAVARFEQMPVTPRVAVRADEALPVARNVAAGTPLPLVQVASAQAVPQVREEGPVRSRLRELASDVRRLPRWFVSAADWVTDAVPRLPIPRLPGRQFRAML